MPIENKQNQSLRKDPEYQKVLKKLEGSLSLLTSIIESTTDGILVVNNANQIVSYNHKFMAMWSIPRKIMEDANDGHALNFVLEQLKKPSEFLNKVRELYGDSEAESHDLIEFKDGRFFERYSRPQKIRGKSVGRVWSFRDVTRRKQMEKELKVAYRKLEVRIKERTAQLTKTNKTLCREIAVRRRLEQELLEVSAREQQRIGMDLHDGLGQLLTGAAYMSRVLGEKLTLRAPEESAHALEISRLLNEGTAQARNLATGLCGGEIKSNNIIFAFQQLVKNIKQMYHVSCVFKCDKPISLNKKTIAINLYRIAQEALNNAAKHGKASHVIVALNRLEKELQLTITDNGIGFLLSRAKKKGLGLNIMSYRADLIGASLKIRAAPHKGTCVTCSLPLKDRSY